MRIRVKIQCFTGTHQRLIDSCWSAAPPPRVGVTAGASAPEVLVGQVVARLQSLGGQVAQELDGRIETITFSLPKALAKSA